MINIHRKYGWEPVLIKRILIGFKAILEKGLKSTSDKRNKTILYN